MEQAAGATALTPYPDSIPGSSRRRRPKKRVEAQDPAPLPGFADLAQEVLKVIFFQLSPPDLCQSGLTCRAWRVMTHAVETDKIGRGNSDFLPPLRLIESDGPQVAVEDRGTLFQAIGREEWGSAVEFLKQLQERIDLDTPIGGEAPLLITAARIATDRAEEEWLLSRLTSILEAAKIPQATTLASSFRIFNNCFFEAQEVVMALLGEGSEEAAGIIARLMKRAQVNSRASELIGLLLERGANVNVTDNQGRSALHWALHFGSYEIAEQLIKAYASLDLEDQCGMRPLHAALLAPTKSSIELMKLFHLAAPRSALRERLDARDHAYRTALHLAVMRGDPAVVKALKDRGASIDIEDIDLRTPLAIAKDSEARTVGLEKRNYQQIIRILDPQAPPPAPLPVRKEAPPPLQEIRPAAPPEPRPPMPPPPADHAAPPANEAGQDQYLDMAVAGLVAAATLFAVGSVVPPAWTARVVSILSKRR